VSGSTVLVVGAGGREHALAWKLAQSPSVARVIVAPGNPGMPRAWTRWTFGSSASEFAALAMRARDERVDLVVVGPDNPLADGLVDVLEAHGCLAFGPSRAAARVEASKAFAKKVMKSAGVPTARYWVARSLEEARKILKSVPWGAGWVIKADGLALGKGVRVCSALDEALQACEDLIRISPELVIEERLTGEELSWMAFCDGTRCALLEPARDYKRVRDGDEGPNTGGMGAFSPIPGIPAGFGERVRAEVFEPALRELARLGASFKGLLYAGIMADFARDQYWVLEFNARFGDPETQALMPRIQGDIYPWFEACARGELRELPSVVPFVSESAVFVVGAARGYPESPEKGQTLAGLSAFPETAPEGYFCAGVALSDRTVDVTGDAAAASGPGGAELMSAGGRVFGALGMGTTLESARSQAYDRLRQVSFEGMHFRRDVGVVKQRRGHS
jgi:phosphoribosylamine--glycine ligase